MSTYAPVKEHQGEWSQVDNEVRSERPLVVVPVLACVGAGWIIEKRAPFLERHSVLTWSKPLDLVDLVRKIGALIPSLAA